MPQERVSTLPQYPTCRLSEVTTLRIKKLKIIQTHTMTTVAASYPRFLRIHIRRVSAIANTIRQSPRQLHVHSRFTAQKSTLHRAPSTRSFGTTTPPKIPLTFPSMVSEDDFILTLSCPEYVCQVQSRLTMQITIVFRQEFRSRVYYESYISVADFISGSA
jgi:hypothetical protein